MALTLPFTLSPNDFIDAEPLQANFQAIIDKLSGNIVNDDISTLAAILGTKIAANSMPGDRIATGTITQLQLAANSVGAAQILALAVDKTKLSLTAGSRVTLAQTEIKSFVTTGVVRALPLTTAFAYAEVDLTTAIVGGVSSWALVARVGAVNGSGALAINAGAVISPATAIPSASTTVLGCYARNVSYAAASATFDVVMLYIDNS